MIEQDSQGLELFERSQVLFQGVSISHDFLSPDAHVLHAQLKKKVSIGTYILISNVMHIEKFCCILLLAVFRREG